MRAERGVYFAEANGRIKIGISSNAEARIAQLRNGAGTQVSLLVVVAGGIDLERDLHRKLAAYRVDREWYSDCPEVRSEIRRCATDYPRFLSKKEPKVAPPEMAEAKRLIRLVAGCGRLAEVYGAVTLVAITRVAAMLGWPRTRTRDIWYGQARRIKPEEMVSLRAAASLRERNIKRVEKLRTRLRDQEFHREDIAALEWMLREIGA